MKFAAILLIFFALAPAAWAHYVFPAQGGLIFIAEQSDIFVFPEQDEQCEVTAEAVEQVISGTALLTIIRTSEQPALKVSFHMSAARPAIGPVKTISSGAHYVSEHTSVYVTWEATGMTTSDTPDANCNGRGSVSFEAIVLDAPPTIRPFTISNRGAASSKAVAAGTSSGSPATPGVKVLSVISSAASSTGSPATGYARILTDSGNTTPSGSAIFGYTQNNVLVSEAAVPAAPLVQSARTYAEISTSVNTGLAIANPNGQDATINFYLTDKDGFNRGSGSTTVTAKTQLARFLDQNPYGFSGPFEGTLTITSSLPISVVALRGLTNERGEFLITTLPVTPVGVQNSGSIIFPHFADGGGWKTQVILVNPTDSDLSGNVQFFSQGSSSTSGQPLSITINGVTGTTFSYALRARSSVRFVTGSTDAAVRVGSVRVVPATASSSPSGVVVFSYTNGGVTVAEAGVPPSPVASAFRLFAEASGNFAAGEAGSMQTGLAIANSSPNPAVVTFELSTPDGLPTGTTGFASVPGNGQIAMFLNQISGLQNYNLPFRGVLRIAGSGISVVGLRGRYNERKDFLITSMQPVNELTPTTSAESLFPHLAAGGGYTTQFILFSGSAGQSTSGALLFLDTSGNPLPLTMQ